MRLARSLSRTVLAAIAAMILVLVVGCVPDRWTRVEPGEYVVAPAAGALSRAAAQEVQSLQVNRCESVITFTLADGSYRTVAFTPRDRSRWPAGCPSNVNMTRMEVLDIAEDPLTVGDATIQNPVLVRDCPPQPPKIILRNGDPASPAGAVGGSGGACADADACVILVPGDPGSADPTVKGYELYSWQEDQVWRFTLTAGTNRVKTYEEVTRPESGIQARITAGSVEELRTALDRLPSGASVIWRGRQALEQIGMEAGDLALPPRPLREDIAEHAEGAGVELVLVR